MTKRQLSCAALWVICAFSGPGWANFTCQGQVTYLGLTPDGTVHLGVNGYGVWVICNTSSPFAGNGGMNFTAESCRSWYAAMLATQKASHSLRLYFSSPAATSNGPECTALGSWVVPNPSPYHMDMLSP